jgi:type II secretion system protein N
VGSGGGAIMIGKLAWPPALDLKKEPLLWVLVGTASFVLFLLLTFPYGTLQSRVLSDMTTATGWEVRAADWSPGIPVAVEWNDVTWTRPGGASVPIHLMRLNIGVLGLIMGQHTVNGLVQFSGSGQTGTGRATATISASSWSFLGPVSFKGQLQHIDLAAVAKPYVTRGLLQADIAHRWENHGKDGIVFKGDGSWKVEIKELVLDRISIGTTVVPSLSFSRVNAILNCRDAVCDVLEFKGEGPDGTVTAQGRILLQPSLPSSMLDLSVTVQAGAGWAQKAGNLPIPPLQPGTPLTFKLGGAVANPKLTL